MLTAALKQSGRLVGNAAKFATIFASNNDRGVNIPCDLYSAENVYRSTFDIARLYQCEVALLRKDASAVTESQKLLVTASSNGTLNAYLAKAFYLGAVRDLRWPTTSSLSPGVAMSDVPG